MPEPSAAAPSVADPGDPRLRAEPPVRCVIVPPVPVPYREPLFARLAACERLALRVIYQSAQAAWNQPADWFAQPRGYEAVRLAAQQLPRPGRTPIMWPRGLERELSAFDPAVVVVSEFGPAALRALAWCRPRRRALVVLTEVTPEVAATLPAPQRALHRWLAARAQGFVAVSSRARERLLGLGVAPDAVALSLQSADLAPIRAAAAARPTPRPPGGPVYVATVARLVPDKNHARLLEAFARAGLRAGEAELHLHGVGPLEGELRALAARLDVPATFHGYTPPAALPDAYAAADAFALVSTFEPFGAAVREAVAAGLPLVCSRRVGAVADLAFEGGNALLVEPDDVAAIAGALARVCRDERLRADLAAGSRGVDAEHGLERDVAAFADALLRAAGRAGA